MLGIRSLADLVANACSYSSATAPKSMQQLSPVLQPQGSASRRGFVHSPLLYPQPEERLTELQSQLNLEEDLATFSLTSEPETAADKDSDYDSDDARADLPDGEADEGVSMPGVMHSPVQMLARRYATPGFANALLDLLRNDLQVPGWASLLPQVEGSALAIHKVSGALTNAVFFVSAPDLGPDSPPTVLVRIYGPSSDSLISRRTELHVLHTLSNKYQIGPAVLGTFGNGRVEQYFRSRALHKEEMRQPRISKWIARRMRQLHSVPPDQMRPPEISSSGEGSKREGHPTLHRNPSSSSLVSTSSVSSCFSFSSAFSASSAASSRSTSFVNPSSPASGPGRPGLSESKAPRKRRSNSNVFNDALGPASASGYRSASRPKTRERLAAWDNISRWTQESSRVLKAIERLRPLVEQHNDLRGSRNGDHGLEDDPHLLDANPLSSPAALLAFKDAFNLPAFEKNIKGYRAFVTSWEKTNGKSKRVLCHNDAQYGNLLIRLANDTCPQTAAQDVPVEEQLSNSQQMIIVVDFEYAALNPRGYDIANHFIEWQADYHSDLRSHSLSHHLGPPSLAERRTFYRSYMGIDNGTDDNQHLLPPYEREDQRILRLEAEVAVWEGASHASWAQWAIVQARDAIINKVELFLKRGDSFQATTPTEEKGHAPSPNGLHLTRSGELRDADDALQLDADDELGEDVDFDYLRYALERVNMFAASCNHHNVSK